MLERAGTANVGETITPEEAIKDPFVLEFLGLKDEYSETGLEEGLIHHSIASVIGLSSKATTTFVVFAGDRFHSCRLPNGIHDGELSWRIHPQIHSYRFNATESNDKSSA
jgi:hypothetical protein